LTLVNSFFRRDYVWQAVRTLAACGLAWVGASMIGLKEIYWALITAVFVTQPGLPETLKVGRDRVLGAMLGAAAGLLVLEAIKLGGPTVPLFWAALVPLAVITARWPNMRFACATLIVLILVPAAGPDFGRPIDRVVEILVGVFASIVATVAIRYGGLPLPEKAS
jgi:uncharacterized membrane protein YccC